jgi:hypothetical protein
MRRVSISLLLLAAAPLFGQLPSNTLNIAATRSIVLQPDQVVFGLTVSTPVTVILFEVVDGLSGLGITSANLSGVDNSNATTLQWNFTLAVPLSNLAATINSLANFQQTSPRRSLLALTFSVNGTQVSQKIAAIAILLQFRSNFRRNYSSAEIGRRSRDDTGTDRQVVQHTPAGNSSLLWSR